jgi:hypothetical protein
MVFKGLLSNFEGRSFNLIPEFEDIIFNNVSSASSNDTSFPATLIFGSGISNVKGGLKVLSDMDYPKEILEQTSEHFLQKN